MLFSARPIHSDGGSTLPPTQLCGVQTVCGCTLEDLLTSRAGLPRTRWQEPPSRAQGLHCRCAWQQRVDAEAFLDLLQMK